MTQLLFIGKQASLFTIKSFYTKAMIGLNHYISFPPPLAQQPPVCKSPLVVEVSRSHSGTPHTRQDSSGRVISSTQRPLQHTTLTRPRDRLYRSIPSRISEIAQFPSDISPPQWNCNDVAQDPSLVHLCSVSPWWHLWYKNRNTYRFIVRKRSLFTNKQRVV